MLAEARAVKGLASFYVTLALLSVVMGQGGSLLGASQDWAVRALLMAVVFATLAVAHKDAS